MTKPGTLPVFCWICIALIAFAPTADAQDTLNASHLKRGWTLYKSGHQAAAIEALEKALRTDSTRSLPYVLFATVLVQTGDAAQAARVAKDGLEKFPEDERLVRLRASALYKLGRREDLLPVFRKLYQLEPDDVDVGITYGQLLINAREPEEAQRTFEALLARFPRERKIYDVLVSLNKRRLNYAGAIEVLRRERKHFPEDVTLAMQLGALLEQTGAFEAARRVYREAQMLAPRGSLAPSLAVAASYVTQDSLSAARAAYRSILSEHPRQTEALVALGSLLEELERWREALDVYKRLNTLGDRAAYAQYKMGRAYEALQAPEAALDAYQQAIRLNTSHPGAYVRRAVLMHELGDGGFQEAERAVRRSFEAVEDLQQTLLQGLRQRSQQNKLPQTSRANRKHADHLETYNRLAKESFQHLVSSFPFSRTEPVVASLLEAYKQAARLRYLAALYYEKQEFVERAESILNAAIRISPTLLDAHIALGRLYEKKGETRQAILAFERARALDETAPEAYDGLIRLYRQSGQLDVLIERWHARLRSAPDKRVLREHLIEALHKAGRYDEAREVINVAEKYGDMK